MQDVKEITGDQQTKSDDWFDEFVHSIRVDHEAIKLGVAPKAKKELYQSLMDENITDMIDVNVSKAKQYYISNMLLDYINVLADSNRPPFSKLAVSFHNSELLVWVEIEDDAWEIEKSLIMAEAKINAIYHKKGFDMSTTIVEVCDQLPVPNHYISLYESK